MVVLPGPAKPGHVPCPVPPPITAGPPAGVDSDMARSQDGARLFIFGEQDAGMLILVVGALWFTVAALILAVVLPLLRVESQIKTTREPVPTTTGARSLCRADGSRLTAPLRDQR